MTFWACLGHDLQQHNPEEQSMTNSRNEQYDQKLQFPFTNRNNKWDLFVNTIYFLSNRYIRPVISERNPEKASIASHLESLDIFHNFSS